MLADRFELRDVLGRGGMATVWSAHDRRLDRMVAVKVLRDDLSDEHTHRIEREARAAARITDPRVVTVLDLDHDADGTPFLVMEALDGRTLADELQDGPLPLVRAQRLAADLLGALAAAHECGVLHRDVKPSNVLADGDGYRVTDFGIASLDDDATDGDLMGTLVYVAPERFEGAPASPRTDVFSAAAVVYEALAGRQPFRHGDAAESLERMRTGRFDPLPDTVPAAVARAVTMGLDPDPGRRPADAGSFSRLIAGDPLPSTEPVEIADPTERLDRTEVIAGPAQSAPAPAPDGPPTSVLQNRVAPQQEPARPGLLDRLRDDSRARQVSERLRTPQAFFIALGVLLLLVLLFAASTGGGDGGAAPLDPTGTPAEQLDQQLDRIEEIGR